MIRPVVFNPPLCTFCMSLLSDTHTVQFMDLSPDELMICIRCVKMTYKRDMQNVQNGGSPGTGLKTTGLDNDQWKAKSSTC